MPGSPTTPGRTDTRDDAPVRVAFRDHDHVGTRDYQAFAAQWLAYALPCRRFAVTLAGANARLGADVDRYSFIVVDLHHLLLAGFDRRTIIQELLARLEEFDDRSEEALIRVAQALEHWSPFTAEEEAVVEAEIEASLLKPSDKH